MIPTLDISPDHDKLPRLLTVQEVSRILHLGRSTVYKLIQLGELPCVRFGRSVRVRGREFLPMISQSVGLEVDILLFIKSLLIQ